MRDSSRCRAFFVCLFFTFSISLISWAQSPLGRGLDQLAQFYESGSPKLLPALKPYIKTPTGEVLVEVHLKPEFGGTIPPLLTAAGFRLEAVSILDPTLVEGYLPLSGASMAKWAPEIRSISAEQMPKSRAGSVQSQAVAVEKADRAQTRGFDGRGIRVGVLSDSYNVYPFPPSAADDVASGDLPPDVVVLDEGNAEDGSDEGREMLQLIHDIAPSAKLGFATGFKGQVSFSNNILALRRIFGADVIVDDIGYNDEAMYSDGLLARTVDQVVSEGAAYFSAAGNAGLDAYEDEYQPISFAEAKQLVTNGNSNLDLDGLVAEFGAPVSFQTFRRPDGTKTIATQYTSFDDIDGISFQWDEPFGLGKVKTDLDILVFDVNGHWLAPWDPNFPGFYTLNDNPFTDEPFEVLFLPTLGPQPGDLFSGKYQLAIANWNGGPAQHVKYVAIQSAGQSEHQNAPSVFGHAAARHGQAVAAMFYSITNFPEDFSSPGPVTIYLDSNGDRLPHPEIRQVPQITGIDGADTTMGQFLGTSAAAPDVAAVAALVLQWAGGPGSMTPDAVYRRLQRTATPVPLSALRTVSGTIAGPVVDVQLGNFTRFDNYFNFGVLPITSRSVTSVSLNVTKPGMVFSSIPTRFHIGEIHGLSPSDVTPSRSADGKTFTLSFAPGKFRAGGSLNFGMSVFDPVEVLTFEDADRFEGAIVKVTLDNGSTQSGTVLVAPKLKANSFTGAGLVNADAATRN